MKTIKYIILIGLLFLLFGCSDKKFMQDYPQLKDKNHIYEVINADKMMAIIENKETCIVVMGFKACPWCQALVPYVNEVAKQEGLKKIYYLDILDMRDNNESADHGKYLYFKEYFSTVLDKEKDRINAPTVLSIKDGELMGFHLDTVSSHLMEDNILPPLNSKQEEELKNILQNLIKSIKYELK